MHMPYENSNLEIYYYNCAIGIHIFLFDILSPESGVAFESSEIARHSNDVTLRRQIRALRRAAEFTATLAHCGCAVSRPSVVRNGVRSNRSVPCSSVRQPFSLLGRNCSRETGAVRATR